MEDQKLSDKRKAPDKNASSEDLSDVSTVQAPMKRPRMDLHPEEIEQDPFAFPGDDSIVLPKVDDTTDIVITKPENSSQTVSKIENHKSSEENGTKSDEDGLKDNNSESQDGQFFKKIIERESSPHPEDNNNEEKPLDKQNNLIESGKGKSNSQPIASSSPNSELDTESIGTASTEIEIVIRAHDSLSKKSVFKETTIKSTFGTLDAFLRSHNITMTQTSLGGYMGDVSSEENSTSNYKKRNRWTSSTLGSRIPRTSTKTISTLSPTHSPNDDDKNRSMHKERGRHEPLMSSTKLPEYSSGLTGTATSSSGRLEKMKVSLNGDTSNGLDTSTPSSAKSASDKSKKSSLKDELELTASEGSTPSSKVTKSKVGRKGTPVKGASIEEKPGTKNGGRPASGRRTSKEFAGVTLNASLRTPNSAPVGPSPVRIVAKIEGTMAKPTTKFETEVNNEPVNLEVLSKSKTLWSHVGPGELVFARWRDKIYYSGVVQKKGSNDTWIMDYDDGMTDVASETHIVPIKILGIGTQGVYSPDNSYKPCVATVLGQKFVDDPEVGSTVKYAIKLDGEPKPIWCTRRQLTIKEVDARNLRQEFMPTPKFLKAAEVSLENIVSGPRRRITATNTPVTAAKVVGGAFDVSNVGEPTPESKDTPKSRTKKGGKRKLSESSAVSDISKTSVADVPGPSSKSSDLEEKVHEPAPVKESPKKSKAKEQPLLFEGYQFFLTASGGGDPASAGTVSPAPVIPYDKDEYRELIENHGGKVIDQVGKEKRNDKIFLISDNFARTVKYIYCLAGSIPCVSHKWIQDCLDKNSIVEWKSFELNSGWSIEQLRLIPRHTQKPLKAFKIYITAGSDDLYNYWKPVLTAAHANLLKSKKGKMKIPPQTQVLVTDATCSPEILADAREKNIPIVKPEWLVQTIITGKKADFEGDEKYQVEILDPEEYEGEDDEEEDEEQS